MKKTGFLMVILLCVTTVVTAQNEDAVLGSWLNEEKDAKIEVYKTADKYFGKITWIKSAFEPDGKSPRKDNNNPDPALRSRTVKGLVILSNFKYDDGVWNDGKIYDPKSGKTYSSKMTLDGSTLKIRGFIGAALFGRTTVWSKSN